MKKYIILPTFLICVSAIVLSAQVECEWDPALSEQMPENLVVATCPQEIVFDDYDLVSPFTIYVNVHFYEDDNGNGLDPQTGVQLANDLVDKANFYLDNLEQNEKPGPNGIQAAFVPSAKYRYKIYTDPSNLNDVYGGIWFHPAQNAVAGVYNSKVIDINLTGNPKCYSGGSCTGCDISLYGILVCGQQDLGWYARILNHEMGHSLDLDHVSWCNNQCVNVDIDPEQECDPNCPGLATCDGQNPQKVTCDPSLCTAQCIAGELISKCNWNVGNNMLQQGYKLRALTPCQWEVVFNRVLSVNTPKYSWADNCTEVAPTLFIAAGTNPVWDKLKLLNRNVEIETGATLTITCEVRMAKNLKFVVQRGAKLIVDGGTITNLCPDTRWGGIYVHGNASKPQPDPFGSLLPDDAGVVIIKNNSLVENAGTAISTSAPGLSYPNQVARWGGLVHCENSAFMNNRRAVEFMKYGFPNQSKFINCTMDSQGEGYAGVTIWDTDGITFNRCRFYNMTSQGILTYDAGAIVADGNDFQNNSHGISSQATYPYSAFLKVGELGVDPNYFSGNHIHIQSNASQYGPGLSIINNEFFESNTAIWLTGLSRFFIENNSFDQTEAGIYCYRTGNLKWSQHNYIRYNAISANSGIIANGENQKMQFLCNDFSAKWDFTLAEAGGGQGEIRQHQGSFLYDAGNCFTAPGQYPDISTEGQTLYFRYYVVPEAEPCKIPLNPGNYGVFSATADGCGKGGLNDNPTHGDYLTVKDQITSIQNNGGQPEEELADLLELKDHIIDKLVEDHMESGDAGSAIQLLDEENSVASQLMKYGVQMNSGDYTAATVTLDALSGEVDEMGTFKQIQHINLDRLQQGLLYEMPQSDSLFLESVAAGDMGVKGYARAILGLLFGREFDDALEIRQGGKVTERSGQPEKGEMKAEVPSGVSVYPNPVTGTLTIEMKDMDASSLRVVSVIGQIVYGKAISEGSPILNISTESWGNGLYVLQLFDGNGKTVHSQLVMVNK